MKRSNFVIGGELEQLERISRLFTADAEPDLKHLPYEAQPAKEVSLAPPLTPRTFDA